MIDFSLPILFTFSFYPLTFLGIMLNRSGDHRYLVPNFTGNVFNIS